MATGPFAAYFEAKQARHNDAVPDVLRTASAQRLVSRADRTMWLTIAGGFALCVLAGIGVGSVWPYVVAALVTLAGLVAGAAMVIRLSRLERPD
ncbi:MAG: hypothetical protein IT196_19985 [Acidimicrobiales bacterium]|nr:hypothetical protein [Acidimicrobiales bacterium]